MVQTITRVELKDVLMEPKAPGVKEPYFIIQGERGQNVTVISPGLNGREFNKTYGYSHKYQEAEIYQIAYGQGVLVMQRSDDEGEAKEFRVVSVRAGMTIEVPAGYGHSIVNISKTFLIVVDTAPDRKQHDATLVKRKRGFAYYIVDKKGEVGFEPNPNYRIHPQVSLY